MFESQIINDYRLGLLKGITEAPSCFYIPVRITGTGKTERRDADGNVFVEERLKTEYFAPNVLKHCAALPILEGHPKGDLLTAETLKDSKIVGQTIDAWIQGEEIWGLARVYDKSLMAKLGKSIGSTSPGVWVVATECKHPGVVQKEIPFEINHLAFVRAGHWDQVEGSRGFDASSGEILNLDKESIMAGKEIPLNDVESTFVKPRNGGSEVEVKKDEETPTKTEVEVKKDEETPTKTEAEVKKDEETPTKTEVEVKKDEETPTKTEVEVKKDEFGPKHHSQPSADSEDVEILDSEDVEILDSEDVEILDTEDEEILISENEEVDDKERETTLDSMREVVDGAHPSLKVRMPHIVGRETKRSVVSKFISRNRAFVSPKYANIRIDSMTSELADDILKSTFENIKKESEALGVKKTQGFVPSRYGYVDPNF